MTSFIHLRCYRYINSTNRSKKERFLFTSLAQAR